MYLFGASGHGKVVAEIAENLGKVIDGFIDNDKSKSQIIGYPIFHEIPCNSIELVISIGNNKRRSEISESYPNFIYKILIHPNSFLSKRVNIGEGTVVMSGVSVNADVNIGKHCIVNTNASIDHDCIISDFVHVSPNVGLAGNVEVGEGTHIGIGANVIQGVKIGKWCVIGAGAVVIRDVPDNAVVVGNPGEIIKIQKNL